MSSRRLAAVTAATIVFAGGVGVGVLLPEGDALRVSGSEVGRLVWETREAPSDAPRCRTDAESGIGRWTCEFVFAPGDAPVPRGVPRPPMSAAGRQVADLDVQEDGSVTGRWRGGEPFEACCVDVR